MKKIKNGFIHPSAAYTISRSIPKYVIKNIEKKPEIGDLVYGKVEYVGQHTSLENKEGRIHAIYDGTKAVFVYGNRYAPDYYEGFVPEYFSPVIDLLSRSGIIGNVTCKSSLVHDPTKIKILGYVCNNKEEILNTRNFQKINPKIKEKKKQRAKLILTVGTSMNSGKSAACAACCWALSAMGHQVRASKITGTASLKDILLMEDNGANPVSDFTYFGYPSTYMLNEEQLINIFNTLDLKYANNSKNYWIVEIADGLLQRETSILLHNKEIKERIHKLIFAAHDAFGAIGGLKVLKDQFNLIPDAISGIVSSSPLGIRELSDFTDIPVFNSMHRSLDEISKILI